MKKYIYFLLCSVLALTLFPSQSYAANNQLIVINKQNNQLAFYENNQKIKTFSVATGKTKNLTPEGVYSVTVKWECPVYYATNKKGCTSGNPLGPRWIGLNVPGTNGYTYGIHGNNNAKTIGTYASNGCVRMHNEEVKWLFSHVQKGAKVVITNSSQTHDEIAKKHGYKVGNSQTPDKKPITPVPPVQAKTHTVIKGDTLYSLSKKYGVSVTNLQSWNKLKSNTIYTGQKLIVKK